jgi:folate-binding protein YgfZ
MHSAGMIMEKLMSYRLRSKVLIQDLSDQYYPYYSKSAPDESVMTYYKDPRFCKLGYRVLSRSPINRSLDEYVLDKYEYSIPDGECDLIYDRSMPLEYGIDKLKGISYSKGCYIGQEVINRTKNFGEVRKGVFKIKSVSDIHQIAKGTEIISHDRPIGALCSSYKNLGIGLIRLDEYQSSDQTMLTVGGISISLSLPEWAK